VPGLDDDAGAGVTDAMDAGALWLAIAVLNMHDQGSCCEGAIVRRRDYAIGEKHKVESIRPPHMAVNETLSYPVFLSLLKMT
jgi:hypothetical protein